MRVFISFSKYELYINLKRLILDAVAKTMKKENNLAAQILENRQITQYFEFKKA